MSKSNEKHARAKISKSFKYAFEGIKYFITYERNAKVHSIATVFTILAGWYFDIDKVEWLTVIVCIGFVWTMEIINTALETICDYISPTHQPKIKIIKDLSAAAVLVSAITAAIVGGYIFIPRIVNLIVNCQ